MVVLPSQSYITCLLQGSVAQHSDLYSSVVKFVNMIQLVMAVLRFYENPYIVNALIMLISVPVLVNNAELLTMFI